MSAMRGDAPTVQVLDRGSCEWHLQVETSPSPTRVVSAQIRNERRKKGTQESAQEGAIDIIEPI